MEQFLFRLALELGKTVGELSRDLTARELASWMAYFQLNPLGRRDDERMAVTCATIAQCAGNSKVTPEDFLPKEVKPQTIEEQIAVLKSFG
jgi:hypothetical protein